MAKKSKNLTRVTTTITFYSPTYKCFVETRGVDFKLPKGEVPKLEKFQIAFFEGDGGKEAITRRVLM